jgi:predicted regulator of Ras-like GTPase activity (Roadblock/LC7/MglB family)
VHNDSLVSLLSTVHRLLDRKGSYRVFYTVFREAQLVLRPLDRGYLAVLTRNETNLGQLLYRISKIEAIQVGER